MLHIQRQKISFVSEIKILLITGLGEDLFMFEKIETFSILVKS